MINFANVKEWRIPVNGTMTEVTKVTCVIEGQTKIIWQKDNDPYTEPFYIENITNQNETLSIRKVATSAPTLTIEYLDDTIWKSLCTTSTTAYTQILQPGEKIYLRCSANAWRNNNGWNVISGVSKVGGNIMSLLYGDNFADKTIFPSGSTHNFYNLFSDNNKLVDASNLLLPATTLTQNCYRFLFSGCTALTTAPVLPATTLANSCYYGTFFGCTSLTTAPELPATTLVDNCYCGIFAGCSGVDDIKCYAIYGINENNSTSDWLYGVSERGNFRRHCSADWPTGTSGIPSGWNVDCDIP